MKVFDSTGKFIRTVGRSGEGPLEFRFGRPLFVDAHGQVHAFDRGMNRRTIISENFAYVAEVRTPAYARSAAILDDSTFVSNMWVSTPSGLGEPVHLIAGDRVSRSFGHQLDESEITQFLFERVIASTGAGRVFAARSWSYDIVVFDERGQRRRAALRGPPLNAQPILPEAYSHTNPPPSRIFGIRSAGSNYLLVARSRRRNDWKRHWIEVDPKAAVRPPRDWDAIFDGEIDVIDTRSLAIVARASTRSFLMGFADSTHVFGAKYLEDGTPQLVILKVTLSPPSPR